MNTLCKKYLNTYIKNNNNSFDKSTNGRNKLQLNINVPYKMK